MHKRQIAWSGVAAVLLSAAVVCGADGQTPAATGPAATGLAEADLVVGDRYTIEITRGGIAAALEGKLLKATDRWIVLRNNVHESEIEGLPILMDIPLVGRLFRREYTTIQGFELWIPREACIVKSHVPATKPAAADAVAGDEPPTAAKCSVHSMPGGKISRLNGYLTAVDKDNLTLVGDLARKEDGRQIARGDVVYIAIRQEMQEVTVGDVVGATFHSMWHPAQ